MNIAYTILAVGAILVVVGVVGELYFGSRSNGCNNGKDAE